MDESGTHNTASVLAVSAYIAKGSEWQAWTRAWSASKKPIKVFHATDCQNFRGELAGWNALKRDAYVAKLLETIPRHIIVGVVIGIQMDDLREAMEGRPDLLKYFGTP